MVAPTEVYDSSLHTSTPTWFACRGERGIAHGEVHDDNAFVMGGVAGHAGLFGHALGVFEVARAWAENNVPGVSTAIRDEFWHGSSQPGQTYLRGWDSPNPDGSGSAGAVLSRSAAGHTGYTGTSLWIDPVPESDPRILILLSNRVHPTRQNTQILEFRRRFHAAAVRL